MEFKDQKTLPLSKSGVDDEQWRVSSPMTRKGVYAAISYMACAVLLILFNKAALSSYKFPCANVITLFQMICSSILLYALRCRKIISFIRVDSENHNTKNIPGMLVPSNTLITTLPLAISYLLYMLVSMESVRGVSLPMYTTLRRTTVAFTMLVEYVLARQRYSLGIVGSVGIIILGAFIAGARDLSFDSYAYTIVFSANICTAVYLASIARIGSTIFSQLTPLFLDTFMTYELLFSTGKSSGLNSFGLMWCNGLICTPILLLWTWACGDLKVTANFSYLSSLGFQVVMLLSCVMAFLLNYAVFLNTTLNSALTQTICGNLKDLFTIGFGWLLFGGLPFDMLNVMGQSLGFLGSCIYAFCKIKGL